MAGVGLLDLNVDLAQQRQVLVGGVHSSVILGPLLAVAQIPWVRWCTQECWPHYLGVLKSCQGKLLHSVWVLGSRKAHLWN